MDTIYLISYLETKNFALCKGSWVKVPFKGVLDGRMIESVELELAMNIETDKKKQAFFGRVTIITLEKTKIVGRLERVRLL